MSHGRTLRRRLQRRLAALRRSGIEILLIAGPFSGKRVRVPCLEDLILMRDPASDVLACYVQDSPGETNYYFHEWMSQHFNEPAVRPAILARMKPVLMH